MAKGKFSVVHKTSDGDKVSEESGITENDAAIFVDENLSELEGDSGATLTVTWED